MKKFISGALGALGIGVYSISGRNKLTEQQQKRKARELLTQNGWLINKGIKTIVDIGANDGLFAKKMRSLLPGAFIYSFEPLQEPYDKLCDHFKHDKSFKGFKFALGKANEQLPIHLNEYSPSSSFLPMKEKHKEHFDFTVHEQIVQNIDIKRLDDVAPQLNLQDPVFIKIDVQGFEKQVIEGGIDTVKKADIVVMEMSFESLYEGSPLFDEMYQLMKEIGFRYQGNYEQLYSPVDGSILQCDAIFFKNGK
jgi:methyltransferase, FkbM family